MGMFDFLKGNQFKKEVESLQNDLNVLRNTKLTAEQMTVLELQEKILNQEKEVSVLNTSLDNLKKQEGYLNTILMEKQERILEFEKELIDVQHQIEFESFGLYQPKYDFATSIGYKAELDSVRSRQKQMIKDKTAVSFSVNWQVDGSKAKGQKMNNDNIKLILRSFNNECEAAINKVKYNNLPSIEKRIEKSFEQLNKLNESVRVSLNVRYLEEKLKELYLAYEYERKKEEEKEELREQRQREREEKALQKEIDSQKKVIDKDITHYQNMINDLKGKLASLSDSDEIEQLSTQISELSSKVTEKEKEKDELDYRNAHASAGYVYIISNIGAFGEDVVKIGVTRRLEPLERISELSSASVPFGFDVHALIFSYEAYQLENELHQYFADYRINRVNSRKEFFKVPIDQIEDKLKEYGNLTIDFTRDPDASEYKESLSIASTSK